MSAAPWTTGRLARELGARCEGDPEREIHGVGTLAAATDRQLAFYSHHRWKEQLSRTGAGAVLLSDGEMPSGVVALRHEHPRWAYARAASLLHPPRWPEPGVSPLAVVHPEAQLDASVTIEPLAVIAAGARLGPGCWVQSHAYVGARAQLGSNCRLMPHAVVLEDCALGDRVRLQPGAVVGGDGFGHARGPEGLRSIPQLGRAVLEDDVDLGVHAAIDRAALGETRVGRGSRLDNFVHVAHGVRTGVECLLAAFAAVSGGTQLGDRVIMAGRAAVIEHRRMGSDSVLLAMSGLRHDLEPGARAAGYPARDHRAWARESVAIRQLPAALRSLRRLERWVRALDEGEEGGSE